ncbi:MAG: hypothetical protein H0V64_15110 [Geodermatophilaceae bacterium]|nr:hypothetical protein [Geodermatophilaceae bacterium]
MRWDSTTVPGPTGGAGVALAVVGLLGVLEVPDYGPAGMPCPLTVDEHALSSRLAASVTTAGRGAITA